ncbi:MAG: hypothetical protein Q4B17_05945 [Lautropia sp.]|nr:hypothetical protein [Lautropia sp.]
MNKTLLIAAPLLLAACGTIGNKVISDDTLQERAAFALGTTADQITISNRRGDTNTVRFVATVGQQSHQCYVSTVGGIHVSDAICSGNSSVRPSSDDGSCNALLKAAGRC